MKNIYQISIYLPSFINDRFIRFTSLFGIIYTHSIGQTKATSGFDPIALLKVGYESEDEQQI